MTYAELAEDVVIGFGGIGISTHGTLYDAQPQTPDVALHAVGAATWVGACLRDAATGDAFRSHVALTADVGFRNAGDEIAADAKIANFDLPAAVDEDIGGFDVAVDDLVFVFEVFEPHDGGESDFSKNAFRYTVAVEFVH